MKAFLWIVYALCCIFRSESRNATDLERLYDDLLDRYRSVNPVNYTNPVTNIDLGFQLLQVEGLNGKTQVLETSGCLNVGWYDQRLSWEPEAYGFTYYITIEATKVWVPLIGLKNSVRKVMDPDWRKVFPVFVINEGLVWWSVCAQFSSPCTLDMLEFPYDTQRCSLDFGNVLEPANVVNLTLPDEPVDLDSFYPSNEFDVYAPAVDRYVKKFQIDVDSDLTYVAIQFRVDLKRKPFYYILNVIIPTVVLAVLSSFTFLIPDDSGEKLSMGVSILLAYTVFILILADNTPQTSQHPPILATYLTTIMTICGINLLIQLLLMKLYHVRPIRPLPKWLKFLRSCLRCFIRHPVHQVKKMDGSQMPMDDLEFNSTEYTKNTNSMKTAGVAAMKEIRVLSKKVQSTEEENALIDEWKLVADTCNRFLFYLSVSVQIMLVIICFGVVPAVTK